MNGLTARAALDLLGLRPGNTLLVTGAAGVLGGYVIQLAKRDGLVVVADAKESDVKWLREIGADVIVPRDGMDAAVRQRYPQGVDGVVDTALLTDRAGALVRDGGGAVSVRKTHPITGPRLRHHHVAVIQQMSNTVALQQLSALVQDSGLAIRIVARMPMSDAAEAHRVTEDGGLRGRVVLTFAP
jgi:NADPH:quinone reductase-like Zn-dependent oxidoreductase